MTVGEELFAILKRERVPLCDNCLLTALGRSGRSDVSNDHTCVRADVGFQEGTGRLRQVPRSPA
jgi:hypothetical protein